ncbi:hypothetical protein SAMN04487926_16112 [Paraburkholderia steynii]|uniref:Preprotein translocase subunit SecA n=1 Tax=Paraburkholderia steynii TaxID=1245441 RepID=A0A7Z7BLV7_9BURK|nr:hypothetical protein [Paraburkholderia steynii]SDJ54434.1 hypothetical protein SAMN04487926_16112 [Paraburkholderia steynii]
MLSPHEFTTLMVVRDAPDQVETDRLELRTLLDLRLVTLEPLAAGRQSPRITPNGKAVLEAVARMGYLQR